MRGWAGLLGLLLLAAVALATFWLDVSIEPEPLGGARHRPDSYMEAFTITRMNLRGEPHNRVGGARMVHFPDDDSTELERPRMLIFRPGAPPWQVDSERGWVSSGGDLVLLQGEVHLHREAGPGGRPIWVDSRDLRVLPGEDFAESDHYTEIRSDVLTLKGVGMRAYLGDGRLKLLNEVRGRYEQAS